MRKPLAILTITAACSSSPIPPTRYANAPAPVVVNDRVDVPKPPAEREFVRALYHFDGTLHRRVTRALELPTPRRALGINALDEVPNSTWFTNRIGHRELTLDELRTGPIQIESPEAHRPWTIHSSKPTGESIGFIISDARGERFLLKFDRKGYPEVETTAHVIVDRLLWACGYNVTEDHIVYFRRGDLRIAPDATTKDLVGDKRRFRPDDLDAALKAIEIESDGRIRALASRFIAGRIIGGHPGEGVREDDPNDLIPHELRRDLRGAMPIFAWLDHGDLKENNFIDTWVPDPADPDRHYVVHYLIDFGKSLGAAAAIERDARRGHEYKVDFGEMAGSFAWLGMRNRSWENRHAPPLPGVGLFEARKYNPKGWKPDTPAYAPFLTADRIDRFWGAKILIRFTPAQIRAVVESTRLSDRRAVDYLTAILVARQRATARHAFSQVNPLDRFEVVTAPGGRPALCFDDLMLTYRLSTQTSYYRVTSFDQAGRELGKAPTVRAAATGHSCTVPFTVGADRESYTILRVQTIRPEFSRSTYVHVARDPTSAALRVIGIWRD